MSELCLCHYQHWVISLCTRHGASLSHYLWLRTFDWLIRGRPSLLSHFWYLCCCSISHQHGAHHSCPREVIHRLYSSIFTPLRACSHHSNHSFHLGSRGSENDSVSGNPNIFNTIPQWWAHLRAQEADTTSSGSSELSKPEGCDKTGLSHSYPTLKSTCTRYPFIVAHLYLSH